MLVLQQMCGRLGDKVRRVETLAVAIGALVDASSEDTAFARRAAHLAKADLVTSAVVEFTDLQGVMGGDCTVTGEQDGGVDFAGLRKVLAGAKYDGWIVIEAEQDPSLRNPLLYQTLGLATLKRLSKDAGLV